MKAALLFLSLLASTTAVPHQPRRLSITWDDVHAFIVTNATAQGTGVEHSLRTESLMGRKTWSISGGGVGWPQQSRVIQFASTSDASTLGSMVDEYRRTYGSSPEAGPGIGGGR